MNNNLFCRFLLMLVLMAPGLQAAVPAKENNVYLKSPDGRLVVTLTLACAAGNQASPRFSLHFRGRELLRESALGLVLEGRGDLLAGAVLTQASRSNHGGRNCSAVRWCTN